MTYRKTVVLCTAETLDQQLECSLHEYPERDCTPKKCAIVAAKKRPSWRLVMESGDICLSRRNMDSYCVHRTDEGECTREE